MPGAISDAVMDRIKKLSQTNVIRDVCHGRTTGVEENLKVDLVLPILECLGFDAPAKRDMEHKVGPKSADIALLKNGKPVLIVECKSIEIDLNKVKSQGLEYSRKKGIEYTLMTNGVHFHLYKSFITGISDERNEPVFKTTLRTLDAHFPRMFELMSYDNIDGIEEKITDRINHIRVKITEQEFLDEVKGFKQEIYEKLRTNFISQYEKNPDFKRKVDDWIVLNDVDTKWSWEKIFKEDSDFSNYVMDIVTDGGLANSKGTLLEKYKSIPLFKKSVDDLLRKESIPVDWMDKLCSEGAYALVNRVLFLRMYEDRVLVKKGKALSADYLNLLDKENDANSTNRILTLMFQHMEDEFPGMYISPLFDGIFLTELEWDSKLIAKLIRRTKEHDFSSVDRDILGEVYQGHVPKTIRRALGQFYTNPSIVKYIHIRLSPFYKADSKVLDPACGSGTFLIISYELLKHIRIAEKTWSDSDHIELLQKQLYGIDIDSFATQLATMNLLLMDLNYPCDVPHLITGNSLEEGLGRFIPSGSGAQGVIGTERSTSKITVDDIVKYGYKPGFDFVIGNPPHMIVKNENPRYSHAVKGSFADIIDKKVNLAALFTKRSANMLKKGGICALILPKPMAWNQMYGSLRAYIQKNYEIMEITDLGKGWDEVGLEQIILFIRKPYTKEKLDENNVRIVSRSGSADLLEHGEFREHYINQEYFNKLPAFPMYVNNPDFGDMLAIWGKVNSGSVKLTEIAIIFRGYTGQSWKEVVNIDGPGKLRLLRGEHIGKSKKIERWGIEWSEVDEFVNENCPKLDGNTGWKGKKFNKKTLVTTKDHIIAKRLVSSDVKIDASIKLASDRAIGFDTITHIVPMNPDINPWYLLAILNSNLAKVFIRDVVFQRSKLTMDLDEPYLGQLPIKKATLEQQSEIAKRSKEITELTEKYFSTEITLYNSKDAIDNIRNLKEAIRNLDVEICKLYGLDDKETDIIEQLSNIVWY